MINNIRIDYRGSDQGIDLNKIAEFIGNIQEMLSGLDQELNDQQAVLIIKVYDGKRMSYSFEQISPAMMLKISQLARGN